MMRWIAALVLAGVVLTAPGGLRAQQTYTLITSGTVNYTVALRGMSLDGITLFFESNDQVTGADTDNGIDVYRASGGTMTLLSGSGTILPATFNCASPDGSKVIFRSGENIPGTGDSDFQPDIFLAANGTITLMTGNNAPGSSALFVGASADCSKVFFESQENLDPNDLDSKNDVYELDVASGAIKLLSLGSPNVPQPAFFTGNSADGNTVFFWTNEPLVGDGDTNPDVYRAFGGGVSLMTVGTSQLAAYAGSSANGSAVFFTTTESLTSGDLNNTTDIYRTDGIGASLVSGGRATSTGATFLAASADGSVVFFSTADPLDSSDVDTADDIYQSSNGVITLFTGSGSPSSSAVIFKRAAPDGSRVIFITLESLVPEDTDTAADVYEASTSGIRLLSPGIANAHAQFAGASADCSVVFFDTTESLSPNDTNTATDAYAATGRGLALVSGGFGGSFVGTTLDGTTAFFSTIASLVAGDVDGGADVYSTRVEVSTDAEAPVVTVSVSAADALAASNWYNLASSGSNGVLVQVSAADAGGVTNLSATDGGNSVLNTSATSGSFSLFDGQHTISASATDGFGNTGVGTGSTALPIVIRVDQTPPTVTCTTPTVLLHATGNVVLATVSDATSGPAGDVSIPLDTSTVGQKTAQATGSDVAGNQMIQVCGYRVIYQFAGFGAPVSSPPNQYVTASVGKNIPLTFLLSDAQNVPVVGLGLKAVTETDAPGNALCSGVTKTLAAADYSKGKSGLVEIGGGNYEYRFKAPRSETGQCRSVSLNFGDGVLHTVNFLFTP
jgi:hypothetical protein